MKNFNLNVMSYNVLKANCCTKLIFVLFNPTEGKLAADDNGCKHIEVSAILNHKVDDLLVGVLEHIRRHHKHNKKGKGKVRSVRQDSDDTNNMNCWSSRTKDSIFTKLFKFPRGASRSCENLLTS